MGETFPSDWRDAQCFLVSVPIPLAPYVTGLLKIMENRGFWASDDDYLNGYTATYELERCFVSTCVSQLIEAQDRLYRMLDTALFGTTYTIESTDPLVVSPAIAAARDLAFNNQDSVLGRLDRLSQTQEAFVAGTDTPLYSGTPNVHALLQGIIDALAAEDTDIGSLLTELEVIAGLLA